MGRFTKVEEVEPSSDPSPEDAEEFDDVLEARRSEAAGRIPIEHGDHLAEVFAVGPEGERWWNAVILKMPGRKSQAFIEYMRDRDVAFRIVHAVLFELAKSPAQVFREQEPYPGDDT